MVKKHRKRENYVVKSAAIMLKEAFSKVSKSGKM